MFHQIEGLAVDTDITFCDFKGTVEYFVREFLGPKAKTRLRPSYFPFTEPSAEVDATCHVCGGSGCRVCKFSGWIELFGAGMVDPAVYGFVKYDAGKAFRLRLRHGRGPPGDDEVRHQRAAAAVSERRALPAPVSVRPLADPVTGDENCLQLAEGIRGRRRRPRPSCARGFRSRAWPSIRSRNPRPGRCSTRKSRRTVPIASATTGWRAKSRRSTALPVKPLAPKLKESAEKAAGRHARRNRIARSLRALHGARSARRESAAFAGLAAPAPGSHRPEFDQQRGGRDQLRDVRAGPAAARLRSGQARASSASWCGARGRAKKSARSTAPSARWRKKCA